MKTLRITLCALCVLFGGLLFSGCRAKDFDASKIIVSETNRFVYDGSAHAVGVSYAGVNTSVKYAFENDRNNFKSLNELQTKDAGTYKVYYKLSAKGYKDYISTATVEFTVEPRDVDLTIADYYLMKSDVDNGVLSKVSCSYISSGFVDGESVEIDFNYGDDFDLNAVQYGEVYNISCTIENDNYNLRQNNAKLYVQDYVYIDNSGVKNFYPNIQTAINNADDGETIVLNKSTLVNNTINVNKSVIIDGQNKNMSANTTFSSLTIGDDSVKSMFVIDNNVANADVNLTLKNVKINGMNVARGVTALQGKVIVDGATITSGKDDDDFSAGGVYIGENAGFEMLGGLIENNTSNVGADLWLGSKNFSSVSTISGGTIGEVYVDSSLSSTIESLKLINGKIKKIYLNHNSSNKGIFNYENGTVENLYVSLKNSKGYQAYHNVDAVKNKKYFGGQLVYVESDYILTGRTFNDNIDSMLVDGENYVFESCVFNAPIKTSKCVGLIFNDCRFETTEGETNLYLTSLSSLIVNNCVFNNTTGKAIDLNIYSTECEDITISNNVFQTTEGQNNVAISIKTRKGSTDHPTDDWATNAFAGSIVGDVVIHSNDFNGNNNIEIGVGPQGLDTLANTTTGDFNVLVSRNLDDLNIYNLFKNTKSEIEAENYNKVSILANGIYNSQD